MPFKSRGLLVNWMPFVLSFRRFRGKLEQRKTFYSRQLIARFSFKLLYDRFNRNHNLFNWFTNFFCSLVWHFSANFFDQNKLKVKRKNIFFYGWLCKTFLPLLSDSRCNKKSNINSISFSYANELKNFFLTHTTCRWQSRKVNIFKL
jgi:hypothetical protein